MTSSDVTTVEAEGGYLPLDTAGRPITPSRLRRAMRLNIAVGVGGAAWHAICGPGMVLTVFVRNHLGASDTQLGLLVSLALLAAPFNLLGTLIYGQLRTRKTFWAVAATIHRLYAFVLAGVSVYVARGGAQGLGTKIILGAAAVSWVMTTLCSSGWWSWLADLVPENIRGSFFGRRSSLIGMVNMLWLLGVTSALDAFKVVSIFYVYAAVFTIAGIVGVADILVHCFIPEPQRHPDEPRITWREFTEPLRNRNFLFFAFTVGLWGFSTGVFGPFIWPYITSADGAGAPQTWMGITNSIHQLMAIATVPFWGIVMDRLGRKPAVLIGSLWVAMRIGYVIIGPANYFFVLPLIALSQGLLAPGYNTGIQQLMLTLAPPRNRTTYVAWYSATVGIVAAAGPTAGGLLKDTLGEATLQAGPLALSPYHVVGLTSLALCGLVFLLMARVREGEQKPMGFVISRLVTPSIFRTFFNIFTIGGAPTSAGAARGLRTMEGAASHLAVVDVLGRLDDPDVEVREEAARALGRIGSPDAVDALIARLRDPGSTIRPPAARALGQIGDPRAVPHLVEGLSAPDEALQEACAQALGEIGGRESVRRLRRLMDEKRTERVRVIGAEAVSKHGVIEAAWEILPHMHRTRNPVLRRQLAIAMGNLLGEPGEFYQYLTGEQSREGALLGRLFRGARKTLADLRRAVPGQNHETETGRPLVAELERVRGLIEGQSYRAAVDGLYQIIGRFARITIGQEGPDDFVLDYAFAHDAKLGLGLWFATEVRHRMGQVSDAELLQIDALLGVYFLSAYRPPAPSV